MSYSLFDSSKKIVKWTYREPQIYSKSQWNKDCFSILLINVNYCGSCNCTPRILIGLNSTNNIANEHHIHFAYSKQVCLVNEVITGKEEQTSLLLLEFLERSL